MERRICLIIQGRASQGITQKKMAMTVTVNQIGIAINTNCVRISVICTGRVWDWNCNHATATRIMNSSMNKAIATLVFFFYCLYFSMHRYG